ncbi:hypothetical protein DIT68_12040 [Brumimicrobium oceani]|uniref:Uncharacterized protein n=1 Tax=Brumimicrobium oceani TaxID=2100725 RepID=A0A2U2XAP9_9FLAO|nr:hypothetical protein DIT68_12040 [Brumimicrobium oceani]
MAFVRCFFGGGAELFWGSRRFSQIAQIILVVLRLFFRRFSRIAQIFFGWKSKRSFGVPADFRRLRRSFLWALRLFFLDEALRFFLG